MTNARFLTMLAKKQLATYLSAGLKFDQVGSPTICRTVYVFPGFNFFRPFCVALYVVLATRLASFIVNFMAVLLHFRVLFSVNYVQGCACLYSNYH
ncbi:hypothetical protein C0039_13220 [Pseudohalioglobus lutimaris]|uniref:Uncharacterized protein n=1 Tax=Pseudohalioglobus lutimaris TaxID=1737061 RepID=A0A2N5X119_9GAMM|nr:hypothetical protein C0039_13220 [Pseudohalioglobus lutimaris]